MTEVEREIQERVAFKLNDVLSALTAQANREFSNALHLNEPMHVANSKALQFLETRIKKEIEMPLPYDDMAEQKFRAARDKAVSVIHDRTIGRGDRNEQAKVRVIVSAVEKAMRW